MGFFALRFKQHKVTMQVVIEVENGVTVAELHRQLDDQLRKAQLEGTLRYSGMGFNCVE